jgi:sugar lactone lactonase YvrE
MKKSLSVFTAVAGAATLFGAGIASAQTLYVTDQTGANGGDLTILSLGGGPTQTVSNASTGQNFLSTPTGIAVDTAVGSAYAGDVFVANSDGGATGEGTVAIFDPGTGKFLGDIATGLTNPEGIAFDSSGNLYVASDTASGSIIQYSGTALTNVNTAYATGLANPYGVTVNALNTLFVSATGNGGALFTISGAGATPSLFNPSFSPETAPTGPQGVVIGPNGDLYVVYNNAGTPQSAQITLAGTGAVVGPLGTTLTLPEGLTFDGNKNLYVADFGANMVTEFTFSGFNSNTGLYTYSSTSTYGTGSGPTFLAFDPLSGGAVPEPSTYALLLAGVAALYFVQRRRTTAPVKA